jgi:hypothetical protein
MDKNGNDHDESHTPAEAKGGLNGLTARALGNR